MLKKVTKFSLIFIIFSLSFGVVIVSDDDIVGSIVVKKISGWQYFATDQLEDSPMEDEISTRLP